MSRARHNALGELAARYPPMLLYQALLQLGGEWTSSGVTRRLDPFLILAEAWRPDRLRRCREHLAAGGKAPPISVVGFRLGRDSVIYGVSDGFHRTVAHREAGLAIKARIGGTYRLDPARYVTWKGTLWRREGDALRGGGEVPDEVAPILAALGVKPWHPPGHPGEEG